MVSNFVAEVNPDILAAGELFHVGTNENRIPIKLLKNLREHLNHVSDLVEGKFQVEHLYWEQDKNHTNYQGS